MTSEREWRFQWPDGTWIRWNPKTETWEKEAGTGPSDARSLDEVLEPPLLPPNLVPPGAERPQAGVAEPVAEEAPASIHEAGSVEPAGGDAEAPDDFFVARARPKRIADEILPPEEEDVPKASILPAVVVGSAIGLGAGVAIINLVR